MNKPYTRKTTMLTRGLAALAFALLCGPGSHAVAQDSSAERKQNIRRLLELTRAVDVGTQVLGESMAQLKTTLDQLPPQTRGQISPEKRQRILSVFEEELRKEFAPEKMVATISAIYEKYLSDEDVKGLIVFYETPLGQKVTKVLPQITREAYAVGAAIGEKAALRAVEKLQAEGTLPAASGPTLEPKPQPQGNNNGEPRRN